MIKCVLFDLDGTIIDDEGFTITSKIIEGKKYGIDIKKEDVIASLGLSRKNATAFFKSIYGEEFPYDELSYKRFEYILNDMKENGIRLKPFVNELLSYLKANHIIMGVCTSTSRDRLEEYAKYGDIFSKFDFIICGNEVKKGKPYPDIYLEGVKRSGISKDETLVVEDANSGVEAAIRGNIDVIMVPDLCKPSEYVINNNVKVYNSLDEVINYIRKVNKDFA